MTNPACKVVQAVLPLPRRGELRRLIDFLLLVEVLAGVGLEIEVLNRRSSFGIDYLIAILQTNTDEIYYMYFQR